MSLPDLSTTSNFTNGQEANTTDEVIEFSIRKAETSKKVNIMRFHESTCTDFNEWKQAKMWREDKMNNSAEDVLVSNFGVLEHVPEAPPNEVPKDVSKNMPADETWMLNFNDGKYFKAIQNQLTDNSKYYIFVKAENDVIEAHPVSEWHNFNVHRRPLRIRTLEEVELDLDRRNKIYDFLKPKKENFDEQTDMLESDSDDLIDHTPKIKNATSIYKKTTTQDDNSDTEGVEVTGYSSPSAEVSEDSEEEMHESDSSEDKKLYIVTEGLADEKKNSDDEFEEMNLKQRLYEAALRKLALKQMRSKVRKIKSRAGSRKYFKNKRMRIKKVKKQSNELLPERRVLTPVMSSTDNPPSESQVQQADA